MYVGVALTIREFCVEDVDVLSKAFAGLQQYLIDLDPEQRLCMQSGFVEAQVKEILNAVRTLKGAIFVAEQNGTFAGLITGFLPLQPLFQRLGTTEKRVGVISDLFICEVARRQGVGKALLEAMEVYLRSQRCDTFWLAAQAFNKGALSFYENQGYEVREIYFSKSAAI